MTMRFSRKNGKLGCLAWLALLAAGLGPVVVRADDAAPAKAEEVQGTTDDSSYTSISVFTRAWS